MTLHPPELSGAALFDALEGLYGPPPPIGRCRTQYRDIPTIEGVERKLLEVRARVRRRFLVKRDA